MARRNQHIVPHSGGRAVRGVSKRMDQPRLALRPARSAYSVSPSLCASLSQRFDVVVVPFPFTDRSAAKRRPALIVSSASFNETHEQSTLAMITSAGSDWPSDVTVQDWREAGLTVPLQGSFQAFHPR